MSHLTSAQSGPSSYTGAWKRSNGGQGTRNTRDSNPGSTRVRRRPRETWPRNRRYAEATRSRKLVVSRCATAPAGTNNSASWTEATGPVFGAFSCPGARSSTPASPRVPSGPSGQQPPLERGLERVLLGVARRRLLELDPRRAPVEGQAGHLVVEVGALEEAPADLGIGHAGGARERARDHRRRPAKQDSYDAALALSSGLRNGEQTAW